MKIKTIINEEELGRITERIMREEETRAKYNNEEFIGLTEKEIAQKITERLGNNWGVAKS